MTFRLVVPDTSTVVVTIVSENEADQSLLVSVIRGMEAEGVTLASASFGDDSVDFLFMSHSGSRMTLPVQVKSEDERRQMCELMAMYSSLRFFRHDWRQNGDAMSLSLRFSRA